MVVWLKPQLSQTGNLFLYNYLVPSSVGSYTKFGKTPYNRFALLRLYEQSFVHYLSGFGVTNRRGAAGRALGAASSAPAEIGS